MVYLLYAYQKDLLLDLSMDDVARFQKEVEGYVKANNPELPNEIYVKKKLTEEIDKMLMTLLSAYAKSFPSYIKFLTDQELFNTEKLKKDKQNELEKAQQRAAKKK